MLQIQTPAFSATYANQIMQFSADGVEGATYPCRNLGVALEIIDTACIGSSVLMESIYVSGDEYNAYFGVSTGSSMFMNFLTGELEVDGLSHTVCPSTRQNFQADALNIVHGTTNAEFLA